MKKLLIASIVVLLCFATFARPRSTIRKVNKGLNTATAVLNILGGGKRSPRRNNLEFYPAYRDGAYVKPTVALWNAAPLPETYPEVPVLSPVTPPWKQ